MGKYNFCHAAAKIYQFEVLVFFFISHTFVGNLV